MGDYRLIDIVNGDRKAFEHFFYAHKDRVNTIALTYTDNQFVAEEITFVKENGVNFVVAMVKM